MAAQSGMKIVRVKWDTAKAEAAAREGVNDGIDLASALVLAATNQVIPFWHGTLAGTGEVDFDKGLERGHVYYDTVYAARLHQNPDFNFRSGRKGKYLSKSMMGSRKHVLDKFHKALKVRFSKR